MLIYLVTYRTRKNELLQRVITTLTHKVGDYTSSGWYVLDIQVFYKGRFYEEHEFWKMFDKEYESLKTKQQKETLKQLNRRKRFIDVENKINRFLKL